jgi:PAS domain S-box-containing protein
VESGRLGPMELRTLLQSSAFMLMACDGEGIITFVSPGLQRILGRQFREEPVADLAHDAGLSTWDGSEPLSTDELPLMRALRGEIVTDALITVRSTIGERTYLRSNGAPVTDGQGTVSGAIVVIQEVTSDHLARGEREELRERLVSTVNHELRTPLAKLLGHAELLRETDVDDPTARMSIDAIWRAVNDLKELAETITDLSDLHGHTLVTRRYANVAEVLRDAVASHGEPGRARGVVLVPEIPAELPAFIDPRAIRRAAVELLRNASTYAPDGSNVRVQVADDELTVRVSVCDDGSGIPVAEVDRLIQPFERGDHPLQPVNSRGLGLAVANAVATAHGGELMLGAGDGGGFCVSLVLPRNPSRIG